MTMRVGWGAIAALLASCSSSENQAVDSGAPDSFGIQFSDVGLRNPDSARPDAGGGSPDSATPLADLGSVDAGNSMTDGGDLPTECIEDDGHCPLACQRNTDKDCPVLIETITAYGKIWRFDGNDGSSLAGSGTDLRTIPRFGGKAGSAEENPCARESDPCTLNTRVWFWLKDALIESIDARGMFWNFDGTESDYVPWLDNGSALSTVDRYRNAAGPCYQKGADCEFDSRTFVTIEGHLIESITAYGKGWNFDASDNNKPWDENGDDLTTIKRFEEGPCQGLLANEKCKFDTRTFVTLNGHLIESITAYGKGWNFDTSDDHKAWDSNGDDLTTVSRFSKGPCQELLAGEKCKFDSRTFIAIP